MFWLGLITIIVSAIVGVTTAVLAGFNIAAILRGQNPMLVYLRHRAIMVAMFASVFLGITGITVLLVSLIC
jgi:hypothetical protein